jgi:hypothetical protein
MHRGRGRAERERCDLRSAKEMFRSINATTLESIGDLPGVVDGAWR